jgi:flagellar basal body-associated protein FliL
VAPVKKRRSWIWILLAILGVIVVGVGACSVWLFQVASGPIDGANAWLAEVDEADYQGAYELSCTETRDAFTLESFTTIIQTDIGIEIDGYNLNSVNNTNGVVTVSGNVTADGSTQSIEFLLRNQDGWKVCEYYLGF